PPKNTPLTTALEPLEYVTWMTTFPVMFHTKYTPLPKFEIVSLSSTAFPLLGSTIVTFSTRPSRSQSTAYNATRCVNPPVIFRFMVNPVLLLLYHVAA